MTFASDQNIKPAPATTSMVRPRIGITLDWVERSSFSPRSQYIIRDSYFNAVWLAGGLPVGVPLVPEAQLEYLHMLDGVIIPGGDYPNPASWYVKADEHPFHPRPAVDTAFVQRALDLDLPLLGICAGMQTMGFVSGGKLYLKVMQEHAGAGEHRTGNPTERGHSIAIEPGSLLARVTGVTTFGVNSHHNEAVAWVGDTGDANNTAAQMYPATVVARADDGVIEAIEMKNRTFALGVQWHPEFFLEGSSPDRKIFEGLIAAARQRSAEKAAIKT